MTDFAKATGIIAEYNPFHNGHKYHIDKTRELFGTPLVAEILFSAANRHCSTSNFARERRCKTELI